VKEPQGIEADEEVRRHGDDADYRAHGQKKVKEKEQAAAAGDILLLKKVHQWRTQAKETLGACRSFSSCNSNSWAGSKLNSPAMRLVGNCSRVVL
jgi:hypothetical protein